MEHSQAWEWPGPSPSRYASFDFCRFLNPLFLFVESQGMQSISLSQSLPSLQSQFMRVATAFTDSRLVYLLRFFDFAHLCRRMPSVVPGTLRSPVKLCRFAKI